jgi:hypothetical protein
LLNLKTAAACLTLVAATSAQSALADAMAPDVHPFVTSIAKATAGARIGGSDQRFERIITFGRNASGELVVTSLSALRTASGLQVPAGTIGVLIVHYDGQCAPPQGGDDYPATQGLLDFVAGSSGEQLWEVGTANGAREIRQVNGVASFGPWETFQADPSLYRVYKCAAAVG